MTGAPRPLTLVDHVAHVRQHEQLVVERAQPADPGVEELHDLGAGGDLRLEVVDDDLGDDAHEAAERHRVLVHELLHVRVVARVAALDDVARQGERRAGEADERDARVELVAHELDGVHHVLQVGRGVDAVHALEVAGAADGPLDDGPVVLAEVEADAHGLQRQQDVGEHDGRVQIEAAERLQRDLRRHVRPPAHLHEAHLLADGAVLGQVAAGLAHEPDGRRVDGFAGAGIEKAHGHHLSRWNGLTGTVIVANGSPWAPVDGEDAGRAGPASLGRPVSFAQRRLAARVAHRDHLAALRRDDVVAERPGAELGAAQTAVGAVDGADGSRGLVAAASRPSDWVGIGWTWPMESSPPMCCSFRGGGRQAGAAYRQPAPKRPRDNASAAGHRTVMTRMRSHAQRHFVLAVRGVRTRSGVGCAQGMRASPARSMEGVKDETSVRRDAGVRRNSAARRSGRGRRCAELRDHARTAAPRRPRSRRCARSVTRAPRATA